MYNLYMMISLKERGRIDIIFFGRGGQGAVTASQAFAQAAIKRNLYVLTNPEYGAERRGAPVKAYLRVSTRQVQDREPITSPDISVVYDFGLIGIYNLDKITKDYIILNGNEEYAKKLRGLFNGNIVYVNAYNIAMKIIGRPYVNMPMLGALVRVVDFVDLDSLKEVVNNMFSKRVADLNIKAIEEAYQEAQVI